MSNTSTPTELAPARETFLALVAELRPELHRYCSRLVGSAIDGEDVVQDTLAKAFYTLSQSPEVPPLRPWLFRIAHNTAIDFLRRYERRFVTPTAELPDVIDGSDDAHPEVQRAALSTFMALPATQRSAVILKDVLGLSLDDIAAQHGATVQAVKALLVRGRAALSARAQAQAHEPSAWRDRPETTEEERVVLARYVALFNQRDWDGVRSMLDEEVRLDLVAKSQRQGKAVGLYYTNYAKEPDVRLVLGLAEGRVVLGVFRGDATSPASIILVETAGAKVALVRDFRYVPYLASALEFTPL
ncbi:MAG: sigma-70 family RNA polymerase sigma factor [Kofleriaceae bacterium]|jgi:RNA polymerase sigma factor (sigma-70 family)|nr:sigma-70 family RNA polymerase sigma factor [Kofleriaceae bacterium]MBP6840700.1 sigma-70 family RNA polymerase sigma factor [Kofleriaceae bacterium]MBP9203450.1 sigma-70 family RNA polymerase sigma factor [Kofleriaceae bacterium]